MVFRGKDPEYSVEDNLNAVTSNSLVVLGVGLIITPFHKNRIQRRTSLMHATLDEAAKNGFQFYQ